MSSTLYVRKVMSRPGTWGFSHPIKGLIARRFYDHDGSLGGDRVIVEPTELAWFEGIAAASQVTGKDRAALDAMVEVLRDGHCLEMWFEV